MGKNSSKISARLEKKKVHKFVPDRPTTIETLALDSAHKDDAGANSSSQKNVSLYVCWGPLCACVTFTTKDNAYVRTFTAFGTCARREPIPIRCLKTVRAKSLVSFTRAVVWRAYARGVTQDHSRLIYIQFLLLHHRQHRNERARNRSCLCGEYHFAFRLIYAFCGLLQAIKSVEIACSGIRECLSLSVAGTSNWNRLFSSYVNVTTVLRLLGLSMIFFSPDKTRLLYYERRNRKHLINFIFIIYFFPFSIVIHALPSVTRYTTALLILFVVYGSIKTLKLWGMRTARTLVLIMRNRRCPER